MSADERSHTGRAWPFLVARGRREGYRSILVPDPMTGTPDEDALADSMHARALSADGVRVDHVTTVTMGDLTVVYGIHRLQPTDVEQPAASVEDADGSQGPSAAATDVHGRPIDLFYGFVTRSRVRAVEPADLRVAHGSGLSAYRSFLADEENFAAEGARSYELDSAVEPVVTGRAPEGSAPRRPASQTPRRPRSTVDEPPARPASPRRALDVVGLAAALVLPVVVILALFWPSRSGPEVSANECVATSTGGSRCTVELTWTGDPPLRIEATDVVFDEGSEPVAWTADHDCGTGGDTCRIDIRFAGPLRAETPARHLTVTHNAGDPLDVPLEMP